MGEFQRGCGECTGERRYGLKETKKVYLLRSENNACYNKRTEELKGKAEGENMNELIKKFRESCDYNIVLIGFMGAGKSTVARTLENGLTWILWKWMNLSQNVKDEYSGDF